MNKVGLVTGASAGLGEHFARLLAKDGHDVILVARSADRLQTLAKELNAKGGGKAHVVPADLTDPAAPQAIFDRAQQLGLSVEFLINNAGFGSQGAFLDLPLTEEAGMVEVNCTALIKLTHLFGRAMRERKSGRILNIASTAGFQAGPYMNTYYATKAFVITWSMGLAYELRGTGVTLTCHCPGATATSFAKRAGNEKSRLFQRAKVAKAEDVAAHAYRAMMAGKELAVHGGMNRFGTKVAAWAPGMARNVAATMNRDA